MKYYKFNAEQFFCEIDENRLIICSFADGISANPDEYLILQRVEGEKDLYEYEICNTTNSGIGGFKRVQVFDDLLIIDFNNILKKRYNSLGVKIYTKTNKLSTMHKCLERLFLNSDCSLSIQ